MTTYRVEPDGDGYTALWRERENGVLEAFATLADGQTRADEGHWPDHGVVFRAAAAVLTDPDEDLHRFLYEHLLPTDRSWDDVPEWFRDGYRLQNTSLIRALRAHAEEATP